MHHSDAFALLSVATSRGGQALVFFSDTKGTIAIRVAWLMLRRSPMRYWQCTS
jgi:hypothetical protein